MIHMKKRCAPFIKLRVLAVLRDGPLPQSTGEGLQHPFDKLSMLGV